MKNPLLKSVTIESEDCSTKEFVLYLLNELQISTTKQLYEYMKFDWSLSLSRFKNLLVELQKEQLIQSVSTYKGTREKAYFLSQKGRQFIQSRYPVPDVTQLYVVQKIIAVNDLLLTIIHWCVTQNVPILSLITAYQASADTLFEIRNEPRWVDARLLIEWEKEEYFFSFHVFLQWLDFSHGSDRLESLRNSLIFGYSERKNVEAEYNETIRAYPNSYAIALGKNDGIVEQLRDYLTELAFEEPKIVDYLFIENYHEFLLANYFKKA